LVPQVERGGFILPALFLAQVIDGRAEPGVFLWHGSEIWTVSSRSGTVGDQPRSGIPHEEGFAAFCDGQQKTCQVLLLFECEGVLHFLRDDVMRCRHLRISLSGQARQMPATHPPPLRGTSEHRLSPPRDAFSVVCQSSPGQRRWNGRAETAQGCRSMARSGVPEQRESGVRGRSKDSCESPVLLFPKNTE